MLPKAADLLVAAACLQAPCPLPIEASSQLSMWDSFKLLLVLVVWVPDKLKNANSNLKYVKAQAHDAPVSFKQLPVIIQSGYSAQIDVVLIAKLLLALRANRIGSLVTAGH